MHSVEFFVTYGNCASVHYRPSDIIDGRERGAGACGFKFLCIYYNRKNNNIIYQNKIKIISKINVLVLQTLKK